MAQLDIYINAEETSCQEIPYLLDIQHNLHNDLKTRMIIPLVLISAQRAGITKLCPVFKINEQDVFASIPEIASFPVTELGKKIGNLASKRDELFSAIDFLLHGF